MVFYMTGQMIKVEAALLILPLIVSLYYNEACYMSFIITIAVALAVGFAMTLVSRPENHVIYAKDGFVVVTLAWIAMSGIGALPFTISGEIPHYIDAVFETISGFTTTGATIIPDIESLSRGILFWRSFTHWVGGMGVLVFVMAIIPNFSDRSMHLIRAEMTGPIIGKLVPKAKETAKILYLIYIALTAAEVIMLLFGGMSLYESLVHSFGTAGTGGFGVKADSIGGYNSYIQWVITIFMLLFGVNFNMYYFILIRHFRAAFKIREIWCYFGIVLVSIGIITANIMPIYNNLAESLRLSAFQVSSIITTTGYATADFNLWPGLSKGILLLLMFIGGCASSTAGGIKQARIIILIKMIRNEFNRMLHPRSVNAVKMEGKTVDSATLKNVSVYFALYMLCLFTVFFILCFEPFSFETNFSAAVACFNNVGPGFDAVGPVSNFAAYSDVSKITLSVAMLLGRLEMFPLLLTLSPSTWAKK